MSARVTPSLAPAIATGRTRERATRDHLRIRIALQALVPTLWLAWVVIHRAPLPLADVGSAALATTVFCLGVIGIVLYVQRLQLLSFPVLFLGVTFLFTCSPLILYQFQGNRAFSSWEIVDIPAVLVAMPVVMLAFSSFLIGSMLVRAPADGEEARRISFDEAPEPRVRALRSLAIALYAISALLIIGFTLTGGALTFAFEGGHQGFHGAKRVGQLSQLVGVSMSRLLPWSLLIAGLYLLLRWRLMRLWRFVFSRRWNAQTLAFGLIAMSEMLMWIRNSSSLEARALSWGWLIVYVVPFLLAGRRRSSAPARAAYPAAERGVRT